MKTKETLFEEKQFNDVAYAKAVLAEADAKLNRNTIGIVCAVAATVLDFTVVNWLANKLFANDPVMGICLFTVILAAIAFGVGGGFSMALKMVWKIGKIAWFLMPICPVDLILGAWAFVVAGIAALWCPVVFVLANRIQLSKDKKAAERYLGCFE